MTTIIKSDFNKETGVIEIFMGERIDTSNAADFDNEIIKIEEENKFSNICFNMKDTAYISSACLRILLKYKKNYPDTTIVEANDDVFEILSITGFDTLFDVRR